MLFRSISIFSEADQNYILEWEVMKNFTSDRELKISCSKKRVSQEKKKVWKETTSSTGATKKTLMKEVSHESIVYEVEFYSRNESALKDLRMEYLIYYEQSQQAFGRPEAEQKILNGEIPIPLIECRKKTSVATNPVEILSDNINAQKKNKDGDMLIGGAGEVHGFRARLYMKDSSGKEIMRSFSYPTKLSEKKFPWKS